MTPRLREPLEQLPFGVTVTDATRTQEEQNRLYAKDPKSNPSNPPHVRGKAVDIRDDEQGLMLWNWILTPEGKAWKEKYGVTMLYHSIEGNKPHYHLEFDKLP